ncbi:YidH family protein [Gordonia sp. NPDC003424]
MGDPTTPTDDNTPVIRPEVEPDYRFTLANERTFLAWLRTSLGLLASSVAVLQFLPEPANPVVRIGLGGLLGALAIVTAAGGLHRWRSNDFAMRHDLPLPRPHVVTYVTVVLIAIAVIAVIVAIATAVK